MRVKVLVTRECRLFYLSIGIWNEMFRLCQLVQNETLIHARVKTLGELTETFPIKIMLH